MKTILTSPVRFQHRSIGIFAGAKTVLRFSALPPVVRTAVAGLPARLNPGGSLP